MDLAAHVSFPRSRRWWQGYIPGGGTDGELPCHCIVHCVTVFKSRVLTRSVHKSSMSSHQALNPGDTTSILKNNGVLEGQAGQGDGRRMLMDVSSLLSSQLSSIIFQHEKDDKGCWEGGAEAIKNRQPQTGDSAHAAVCVLFILSMAAVTSNDSMLASL